MASYIPITEDSQAKRMKLNQTENASDELTEKIKAANKARLQKTLTQRGGKKSKKQSRKTRRKARKARRK